MQRITADQILWLDSATPRQRIYATKDDFLLFFSYYFMHYVKFPYADFHYQMGNDVLDLLNGKIKELGWFQFRESAKTSLAKGFTVWCIANRKFEYINVDSHDKNNSGRFLFDVVLELQTNLRLKRDFGELFNAKRKDEEKTQKSIEDFLTSNGVRVEAHSTQEPIRGRLHGSIRPQLVIMDDFEDMSTVRSAAATRQVREHISELKGGIDQAAGRVLYLGNYLSEAGTVQSIIDRAKTDPSVRVRMVWLLDDQNRPSWPEKHVLTDEEAARTGKISVEEIKRRMRTPEAGDADFMREMMGKPFDPQLAKFNRSMFRYVSREEVDLKDTSAYLLIDPPGQAYSDASIRRGEGDFIGYALVKVTPDGKWMVECWRARNSPKDMIDNIFSLWQKESILEIGIEDTQFWQGLKTLLEEEERKRSVRLNIKELKHGGRASKSDRILALLPRYEQHSIWHVNGRCDDVEAELLRFPISEHDDAMDALCMANEIVQRPRQENTMNVNKNVATAYRYGAARSAAIRTGPQL